ncbi:hypothetical protein [Massilimicrobiota sp. An134]|uniref:hypothetical protein n=1 Tax=Massilimicrobiota sp. An134 TaxID=1965557 RepID=UPI00117F9E5E|nr:hypothetical protein [Massilimicrobiota sp. An134]
MNIMKKNKLFLKSALVLFIGICSISSVFASSYTGKFTMTHMIVSKQSLYLSGKKTVKGTAKITDLGGGNVSAAALTAELVQPQIFGYKICYTTSAGKLKLGSRSFTFGEKKYPGDTYYFALEHGTGFPISGEFTVNW